MRKIYKAVFRDIYQNKSRSLIIFISIFIVIVAPISMFSFAPSIEYSINKNIEDYNFAHIDLRFSFIDKNTSDEINETIADSLGFSPKYISYRLISRLKLIHNKEYYSTNVVGINPNKTLNINKIELKKGNMNIHENETVLLESFAEHLNLTIGNEISIQVNGKIQNFSIIGLIESVEFLSYELSQEGAIYLNENDLRKILELPESKFNNILIHFSEQITDDELNYCSQNLADLFTEKNIYCYLQIHVRVFGFKRVLTDALSLTRTYFITAAILIIIIVGFVIFIITKRYAVEQRKQTGVLYSFGFSSSTIMKSFLLRTLIISTLAIVIGYIASYYFLSFLTNLLANQWGVVNVYTSISIDIAVIVIISTILITQLFTYFAAKENVSLTPYEAIRGRRKEYGIHKKKSETISKLPLQLKIGLRNISRNKMRSILTVLAFCSSIMLSFSLISTNTSIDQTQNMVYDNIYWDVKGTFKVNNYRYSQDIYNNIKLTNSIDKCEPYLEAYIQPIDNYNMVGLLRGVLSNSTLYNFDLQKGESFSTNDTNEIIISEYLINYLGFEIGDELKFNFHFTQINTTIVGIFRDMEMPISIIIQLETLKKIFNFYPINGLIASAKNHDSVQLCEELNDNQDIKIAIKKSTYEKRIGKMIESQMKIVEIMIFLGLFVSFLSIFSTTFIIIIERNREIALQRVFGFSNRQILEGLFSEILSIAIFALIFGFIGGNYLSHFWKNIVSSNFFSIDDFLIWSDYGVLILFSITTIIISLIPEYKILKNQCLADSIKEV